MGLSGCVMYAKATIFDLILPRVAAGLQVTKQEIAALDSYLKWALELSELLGAFDGPILWVSHELGKCCRNCARVCVMENGLTGALLFSVGSDGTDGPTDAAGGWVDGNTAAALREKGIDIEQVLARNDAYRALQACGGLITTGPTGTNVNDLTVLLVE